MKVKVATAGCRDSSGVERVEGSHWTDDTDPCLSCHCVDGEEWCEPTACPVKCKYPEPVPGECCPRCTGVSLFGCVRGGECLWIIGGVGVSSVKYNIGEYCAINGS